MTAYGVSVWWPVGVMALVLVVLLASAVVADLSVRSRRRDVNDQWPRDLADGGRMDQQQREDLLAGEPVPATPAEKRSVERARKRGRFGRRAAR